MDAQLTLLDLHLRRHRDAIFLGEIDSLVGRGDGLRPMRDDDSGELELPDGLIDSPLSGYIQVGLIKEQNLGFFIEGTREQHPLLLPPGEHRSHIADHGLMVQVL